MKFIVVLILFISSFVIFVKYTKPVYDSTVEINSKISQVEELISKVVQIKSIREKLSRNYAQFTDERLKRLRKILPDHVDNIKLLLDIDSMAARYGMRLSDVKLSNAKSTSKTQSATQDEGTTIIANPSNVKSLSMSFAVKDSYSDIRSFLRDIENSLRLMEVEKIIIKEEYTQDANTSFDTIFNVSSATTTDQSRKEPKYNMTLNIKTFWLKKEE